MKTEYFCGAIETDEGLAYVSPFYQKNLTGRWIGDKKARKMVESLNDNPEQYKIEALYLDKSRVRKCGIIGFSKNLEAELKLPNKKLKEMIEMLNENLVTRITGPKMPKKWKTKLQGNAVVMEPL